MWSIDIQFINFTEPKFLIGLNAWTWVSDKITNDEGEEENLKLEGRTFEIGLFLFTICINQMREIGT